MSERNVEKVRMYDDGVRPLVKVCSQLRCKSMFYSATERPGLVHESDVLSYWCEHTQQTTGCDGRFVGTAECQPGRSCFES